MTVNLSPLAGAGQQFFDNNGNPLSGGKLYSYAAGTTTPLATYTTSTGNVAHANPIVLDSAGRVATGEIWLTAGSNYKFVLMTSADVTLATWDNISGINDIPVTDLFINADHVNYDPASGPSTTVEARLQAYESNNGASFIGYLPAGANADATTVQAKLREIVSVKDFGAVGDGVADDTQAFIDAGPGAFIPAGTYLVDTSLVDVWDYYGEGLIKAKTGQTIWLDGCLNSARIVQKKMMQPFFGFNNGTTNTEIFPGAQNASQGMAYVNNNGSEKIYILQSADSAGSYNSTVVTAGSFTVGTEYEIVSVGTTNFTLVGASANTIGVRFTATGVGSGTGTAAIIEKRRIVEFAFAENGSVVNNTLYTSSFVENHQSLSAIIDNNHLYLYTQFFTQPQHRGNDGGKGYAKIYWNGADTDKTNVTNYQLFGYAGSGHKYENFRTATVCVSTDGKYVIVAALDTTAGVAETVVNWLFVYDREYVEGLADPLNAVPLYYSQVPPPANAQLTENDQGVACDGKYVYIWRGYYAPRFQHIIQKFDFYGNLLGEFSIDDARAQYGISGLLNNATLGNPSSFEPEGIALRGKELLVLSLDNWRANCPVVTYKGKNFAAFATNINIAPDSEDGALYWVDTTKTATDGDWDYTATYTPGNYTQRNKLIYSVRPPMGDAGEESIDQGLTTRISGASINTRSNVIDVSFRNGDAWQVSGYSENTEQYVNHLQYNSQGTLKLFDPRNIADNIKSFTISQNFDLLPSVRELIEIRANSTIATGAGLNLYGANDYLAPNRLRLYAGGTVSSTQVYIDLFNDGTTQAFRPNSSLSGQINLGGASNLWKEVFASNATINTSDATKKQQVRELSAAERAVAVRLKALIRAFKFNDAVAAKGENARIHVGVIAQDVVAAFEAEGLDATRYGLLCYDEWDDEWDETPDTKERILIKSAGSQYGVRYEELLAFVIAAL